MANADAKLWEAKTFVTFEPPYNSSLREGQAAVQTASLW